MILEVCTASIYSVLAAKKGGADRIELCSALSEGGVTPSFGLIKAAVATGITTHVLIRPRGGDFLYTEAEVAVMESDIEMALQAGAHGVVIGALTADGDIDMAVCRRLISKAGNMSITFHRAFDMCRQPEKALEDVIALGCHHLLTSGQAQSALEGIEMLKKLQRQAAGRIIIMPGAGVNASNAQHICQSVETQEIHASAKALVPSLMRHRNANATMGKKDADEYAVWETNADEVFAIKNQGFDGSADI